MSSDQQPMPGVKKNYDYRKLVFAGETFTLGDCVAIKNADGKDFIAKIMRICTNSIPRVNVDVAYFYRPEELKAVYKGAKAHKFAPHEIIASNYHDTLDVFTINNKVQVYEDTLDTPKKIRGSNVPKTSADFPMEEFVVSRFYNISTKRMGPLQGNRVWAKVNDTIATLAKSLENRVRDKKKDGKTKSAKRSMTPSKGEAEGESEPEPRGKRSK